MRYQKLFDYLKNEHGVTLLQSDMQEIVRIVDEMREDELRLMQIECEHYFKTTDCGYTLKCKHCGLEM